MLELILYIFLGVIILLNVGYLIKKYHNKDFDGTMCPHCKAILRDKKNDFIVDTDTDAVYCGNCSEFLCWLDYFQPEERI